MILKKRQLTSAFARVAAHGPCPVAMITNRAIKDLLVELDVVKDDSDDMPSYMTVHRAYDIILQKDQDCVLYRRANAEEPMA